MASSTPWMKFYPADWRADPGLRMCGYAARGLWADLLSLMHFGEPYGHLTVAGKPPTTKQLSGILGGGASEVDRLIVELEAAGVFSRTEAGTIFSRRMVRDKAKADADATNGKRGGNPRLRDDGSPPPNPPPKTPGVNPPHKAQKPEARDQKLEEEPPIVPPPVASPIGSADDERGFDIPGFLKREEPKETTNGTKRGTRLSRDWKPDPEDHAFCRSLKLDPARVDPEFIDYWTAVPGSRGLKLDWSATYRNRCRELASRQSAGQAGRGGGLRGDGSVVKAGLAVMDRIRSRQ